MPAQLQAMGSYGYGYDGGDAVVAQVPGQALPWSPVGPTLGGAGGLVGKMSDWQYSFSYLYAIGNQGFVEPVAEETPAPAPVDMVTEAPVDASGIVRWWEQGGNIPPDLTAGPVYPDFGPPPTDYPTTPVSPCSVISGAPAPTPPKSLEEVYSFVANSGSFRDCIQSEVDRWLDSRKGDTISAVDFMRALPLEISTQIVWWINSQYEQITGSRSLTA